MTEYVYELTHHGEVVATGSRNHCWAVAVRRRLTSLNIATKRLDLIGAAKIRKVSNHGVTDDRGRNRHHEPS